MGGTVTFATGAILVGTTNNVLLSYQWRTNGVNIVGATNATYTTPALALANNGVYYDCVATAGTMSATTRTALLLVVPAGTSYADAVRADHPVVYYRFEESPRTAVAIDSSGTGNNGVYSNVSLGIPSAAAALGEAAGFDGSTSFVAVPALGGAVSLGGNGNDRLTIEAWVQPQVFNGIEAIYAPPWKQGAVHLHWWGASDIRFSVNGNTPTDVDFFSPLIAAGQWAYLAAVYDDRMCNVTLYVNGLPVGTNAYTAAGPVDLEAGWIGEFSGGRFYDGLIDEFAVYTNALSVARVQEHYAAGIVGGQSVFVVITNQPQDAAVNAGCTATFATGATVVGLTNYLLNYQWQTNGVNIVGATKAAYTTPALTLADSGVYYDCVVTATGAISAFTRNAVVVVVETRYPDSVKADNPVVYYRFEETNGRLAAVDSSGGGNSGTYNNTSLGNTSATAGSRLRGGVQRQQRQPGGGAGFGRR